MTEVCSELAKYKEIEEELGCPIEVLFKALKQGYIYSNDILDDKGVLNDIELVYDCAESEKYEYFFRGTESIFDGDTYHSSYTWVNLKNYKITWWLEKDRSE